MNREIVVRTIKKQYQDRLQAEAFVFKKTEHHKNFVDLLFEVSL